MAFLRSLCAGSSNIRGAAMTPLTREQRVKELEEALTEEEQ